MDTKQYMVIIKGEFKTNQIESCVLDDSSFKYIVTYKNGKKYLYSKDNVILMKNPMVINPSNYIIETQDGERLFDIIGLYEFVNHDSSFKKNGDDKYLHIILKGYEKDFELRDLNIKENCLLKGKSKNTFNYLKEIAKLNELSKEDGTGILKKYYDKIDFISNSTALSLYLDNTKHFKTYKDQNLIFPFGCNKSQYHAVTNAMVNQLSVIQGPPGTGKTQTILNIIANLIINNKSVIVVSNNNSATINILEKLSKSDYGFDFMVASLGSADNKKNFIEKQTGKYPNLLAWEVSNEETPTIADIDAIGKELLNVYELEENIALLKEEKINIELEKKYFDEFSKIIVNNSNNIHITKKLSADKIMKLCVELHNIKDTDNDNSIIKRIAKILKAIKLFITHKDSINNNQKIPMFFKIKCFLYGIHNFKLFNQEIYKLIIIMQSAYYERKIEEIRKKLELEEQRLGEIKGVRGKRLESYSLEYLKNFVVKKYNWHKNRKVFNEGDLFNNPADVLKEYPIVLSSTFSAYTSLNMKNVEFDYVIMDEASQVDIDTGALALASAKNAVIVGDLKQLPNVVSSEKKYQASLIRSQYKIDVAYDYANKSFLKSVIELFPSIPTTLLKEHYRCHPRIIGFCNQKFYNNELVIMSNGSDADEPLMVVKTAQGNHERDNYSQRQIDIIIKEILPRLEFPFEEIGIIAPYNNQVRMLREQIPGIDINTVHKFQGREKEVIILSTVDDIIKEFTDDPYLLNVAVSRARKKLIVVISGNEQEATGNIADLMTYIQYNNGIIINSNVRSIFDYLYTQYRTKRMEYLKAKKRISQYDSENLTYTLLQDILKEYQEYGIICFQPLYTLVRDLNKLSEKELKYVLNPSTHLDFTIFNKLSKKPIVAVEVDGYSYHKKGTEQYGRDMMKNHILEICNLPLVRISTNGSDEREKILKAMELKNYGARNLQRIGI